MAQDHIEVTNPYDGSVVERVSLAGEKAVQDAIAAAVAVREKMANMPAVRRGAILNKTAQMIDEQADDLARLMVLESGKPLRYARGEVSRAVETFTFAADEARRLHGETIPMDAAKGGIGKLGYYVRVPIGVIAAITPFNFPLNLVAHKIAPAVAVGCPVVLKPSELTPLTALRLAEMMQEAGLPEGALKVIVGGADTGRWLTTDPRVQMITFTGGVATARKISEVVGIRRATWELGGNAATIVEPDADLDAAISRSLTGGFAYSGQVCISVQRLYVHRDRYDEFRSRYVEGATGLKLGDPLEQSTEIGPMINDRAAERVEEWVQEASLGGALLLAGGERDGRMYRPTVLENVKDDMRVMKDEVFGPVVNLIPYDDFDAVLDAVNDSPFGLQAGVFTKDLGKAMRAVQKLDVGGVILNDVPTFRVDNMPYGGNKDSGLGREGPRFAIEEMTSLKMVVINT